MQGLLTWCTYRSDLGAKDFNAQHSPIPESPPPPLPPIGHSHVTQSTYTLNLPKALDAAHRGEPNAPPEAAPCPAPGRQ